MPLSQTTELRSPHLHREVVPVDQTDVIEIDPCPLRQRKFRQRGGGGARHIGSAVQPVAVASGAPEGIPPALGPAPDAPDPIVVGIVGEALPGCEGGVGGDRQGGVPGGCEGGDPDCLRAVVVEGDCAGA
jgi:hypothetical protein